MYCKFCGTKIEGKECPCGKKESPSYGKILMALAAIVWITLIVAFCVSMGEQEVIVTPDIARPASDAQAEEPAKKNTTISQDNAIRSAEDYLSVLPFSRTGLITQLEYEGFSHDDAVFAVDSLDVNWSWQAYLSAKSYLEMMPFSRKSLTEQLLYEGFTQEQTEAGVKAVGL